MALGYFVFYQLIRPLWRRSMPLAPVSNLEIAGTVIERCKHGAAPAIPLSRAIAPRGHVEKRQQ